MSIPGFYLFPVLKVASLSSADAPAASRGTSLPLVGTQWYLREMGGKTREMLGADSAAFTLVLSDSANLVAGSGAGNRFFGEYRCDLNMLSIRVQGAYTDVLSKTRLRRPLPSDARQREIILHSCGYASPVRLP